MTIPNQAQIDLWKGRVGEKWAALQSRMDEMLSEVTAGLKARAGPVGGLRLLDIGCGSGVTCALWLEGGAEVTGVDVSTPMLAVAERRTQGRARLIEADASVWRADQPFDLVVSQFGVMFFDDPQTAFTNIAKTVRPGGRLLFACWRAAGENPWATRPLAAVRELLETPAPPPPQGPPPPGPFAFADKARIEAILNGAGFETITVTPFDFQVRLADAGGVPAAVDLVLQIGPASAALAEAGEAGEAARAAAPARLAAVLAPYAAGGAVRVPGAVWMVEAVRPA
jgi:SAM-dependent methyltransferase